MAGRGDLVLLFQAKTGSIMLPHCSHLTTTVCRTKWLTTSAKNWGQSEVRLQQGVSTMAEGLLWSLATFLHAPDIMDRPSLEASCAF
eukprot:scaffold69843_cov16-Tisochrysis_lutea.AAC.2